MAEAAAAVISRAITTRSTTSRSFHGGAFAFDLLLAADRRRSPFNSRSRIIGSLTSVLIASVIFMEDLPFMVIIIIDFTSLWRATESEIKGGLPGG